MCHIFLCVYRLTYMVYVVWYLERVNCEHPSLSVWYAPTCIYLYSSCMYHVILVYNTCLRSHPPTMSYICIHIYAYHRTGVLIVIVYLWLTGMLAYGGTHTRAGGDSNCAVPRDWSILCIHPTQLANISFDDILDFTAASCRIVVFYVSLLVMAFSESGDCLFSRILQEKAFIL